MDNPYCGCELTRHARGGQGQFNQQDYKVAMATLKKGYELDPKNKVHETTRTTLRHNDPNHLGLR